MLSTRAGVTTFSTRAISSIELLTDVAASASLMVASLLGALYGGFLYVIDVQATNNVDNSIIMNIIGFFMDAA